MGNVIKNTSNGSTNTTNSPSYADTIKEKLLNDEPSKTANELRDLAQETLHETGKALKESQKRVVEVIKARPITTLLAAFATGAVVSFAAARMCRRDATPRRS